MTIREATHDDLADLVTMGRRFRAESGYATVVADNPEQMRATAEMLIDTEHGVIYVAEDYGGALVGMIGFLLVTSHLSAEKIAGELFWWAEQPGVGLRLFNRAKQWALAQGATKLQMIQPCDRPRVAKLYKHLGLAAMETTWQMDLRAA